MVNDDDELNYVSGDYIVNADGKCSMSSIKTLGMNSVQINENQHIKI